MRRRTRSQSSPASAPRARRRSRNHSPRKRNPEPCQWKPMSDKWKLECHACGWTTDGDALATVCQDCGQPLLVRHEDLRSPRESLAQSKRWDMWRYARQLPLHEGEAPVSLGEGGTPLINAPKLATAIGVTSVWVKDEGLNPTGSFKARGMSAAVTRAKAHNVPGLVVPTAG